MKIKNVNTSTKARMLWWSYQVVVKTHSCTVSNSCNIGSSQCMVTLTPQLPYQRPHVLQYSPHPHTHTHRRTDSSGGRQQSQKVDWRYGHQMAEIVHMLLQLLAFEHQLYAVCRRRTPAHYHWSYMCYSTPSTGTQYYVNINLQKLV